MLILAIETSCDETSVAIVEDGQRILCNLIASQIDIHSQYGGVVPEVAAREHIAAITPLIQQALSAATVTMSEIDAFAVTRGPGLIGSLFIGVLTAKTLAAVFDKPLIAVNHIIAHAFGAFLTATPPSFPLLALTVSGGHTALTLYQEDLSFEVVGQTQDDAAGEAFDKVGRLLGLPYPGGPAISAAGEQGDDQAYHFPTARLQNPLDFSFSGLKTAVLRQVQAITGVNPGNLELKQTYSLDKQTQADLAASFERVVVSSLVRGTTAANAKYHPASLVIGGGVAANTRLRRELTQALPDAIFVPTALCGDNAAMIAATAFKMRQNGLVDPLIPLMADSSLAVL